MSGRHSLGVLSAVCGELGIPLPWFGYGPRKPIQYGPLRADLEAMAAAEAKRARKAAKRAKNQ